MVNLKIKEPDYKTLYFEALENNKTLNETRNKTISGLKGRITRLENENKRLSNENKIKILC